MKQMKSHELRDISSREDFMQAPSVTPLHLNDPQTDGFVSSEEMDKTSPITFDDNLLWCDDCRTAFLGSCPTHGPLSKMKDKVVPPKAKLTLPYCTSLRILELRAGDKHIFGVFAKKMIQRRTQFGPLEAPVSSTVPKGREAVLTLKIFQSDPELFTHLDNTDEAQCNWMMYVRPASHRQEQNMVAYQYQGGIYFSTIKNIPANAELRVWYAERYGKLMGVPPLENSVETKPEPSDQGYEKDGDDEDEEDEEDEEEVHGNTDYHSDNEEVSLQGEDSTHLEWSCSVCNKSFRTFVELECHVCDQSGEDSGGRRTRSKRKGHPVKIMKSERKKNKPAYRELAGEWEVQSLKPSKRGRKSKPSKKASVAAKKAKPAKNPTIQKKSTAGESNPEKVLVCQYCGKNFSRASKLQAHINTHTGEGPLECKFPQCGKHFTSKFKLKRHELIHKPEERQHRCPYCDKAFARKDHLKNHLVTHDPNRASLVCALCNKEYHNAGCYKVHMGFHDAEEGSLTCRVCEQIMETKEALCFHLKVHMGSRTAKGIMEKRHPCPHCEKRFYTPKDVKRHVVTHTKARDFLCQYCPQSFGRRDHLVRHITAAHSDGTPGAKPKTVSPRKRRKQSERTEESPAVSQETLAPVVAQVIASAPFTTHYTYNPGLSQTEYNAYQGVSNSALISMIPKDNSNMDTLSLSHADSSNQIKANNAQPIGSSGLEHLGQSDPMNRKDNSGMDSLPLSAADPSLMKHYGMSGLSAHSQPMFHSVPTSVGHSGLISPNLHTGSPGDIPMDVGRKQIVSGALPGTHHELDRGPHIIDGTMTNYLDALKVIGCLPSACPLPPPSIAMSRDSGHPFTSVGQSFQQGYQ
ncbi:PR domain zinc finger protein 10 isoform X2 [Lingula anatina]|uniref:PR domain zinc finger protein 10 isoform X2 n=1 Tax=Lingula anatina TaxID=7574 RepID=A0A1S3J2Y6_LINAN|nr:PR domain zinc finger protein 10 isoform X2 [Lingula anatina]|eukprot:XP_013404641.1 PR domain zinc finger protein 10 isoform X2 [Lingula anatina]